MYVRESSEDMPLGGPHFSDNQFTPALLSWGGRGGGGTTPMVKQTNVSPNPLGRGGDKKLWG